MIVTFGNKAFDLPAPAPGPAVRVLKVLDLAVIPVPDRCRISRIHFPHPLAKLLFFLLHEGPAVTWRKIRSTRLQKQMLRERQLVFAFGRLEGEDERFAMALGPQACPYAEFLAFPRELTRIVGEAHDRQADVRRILAYLDRHPEEREALFHHSVHAEKGPGIRLETLLPGVAGTRAAGNPSPLPGATVRSRPPVPRRSRGSSSPTGGRELFLLGAGKHALTYLLPALRQHGGVRFHAVADLNPIPAGVVGERCGFPFRDTEPARALEKLAACASPLLVISTHHASHLPLLEQAVSINPRTKVFVEKPP